MQMTRLFGPRRRTAGPLFATLVWLGSALGVSATSGLGQAPPSTDVYLLELAERSGAPLVAGLARVTDRAGYDNQPAFLPDGAIVFSSATDAGHTDILRFDPGTRATTAVVATPQSEYSPTPVPGAAAVSVVRDYGGGNQQLWRFPLDRSAGEATLLLPDVNPVGYHVWIDERRVLLFVLGEPPTLQLATIGPGPGRVVAENPGRCLARIPAPSARAPHEASFVRKVADGEWWLEAFDPDSGATRRLVRMPPPAGSEETGREDYTWSPDGAVWTSDGSRLLRWRAGEESWIEIVDLGEHGLRGVTRLAFDAGGRRLAVVAEP
jgi:hypothetical protein